MIRYTDHPTHFIAMLPDGTVRTVDRRLRSLRHTYADVLAVLGDPRMPPVVRPAGGGLTAMWRDPRDTCFQPFNPLAWHEFGAAVRGPVALLGADEKLAAFLSRPRDRPAGDLPPRIQA